MYWMGHTFLVAAAFGCGLIVQRMGWPLWWLVLPLLLFIMGSLTVDTWK